MIHLPLAICGWFVLGTARVKALGCLKKNKKKKNIREHGSVSLCRDGQKTKWRLQCKY